MNRFDTAPVDESRDEVRLGTPVAERLIGRISSIAPPKNGMGVVDCPATNGQMALSGRKLDVFAAVAPGNPVVLGPRTLDCSQPVLDAARAAILMLSGGLSFRTGGAVHPLMPLTHPETGITQPLLDWQLDRLNASPLSGAKCVLAVTPFNEYALRSHFAGRRPFLAFCVGGLAPRLAPVQPLLGSLRFVQDSAGRTSYNPIGHLEAFRWLVLSGLLGSLAECDVIIIVSYSNWGRIFNETTLKTAWLARHLTGQGGPYLILVEVTAREIDKEPGSMLVSEGVEADDLRLIKYSYGLGRPRLPMGRQVLMSNNTLYLPVCRILRRLENACSEVGLPSTTSTVLDLLERAERGGERDRLAALFDAAFPVDPILIPTPSAGTVDFLRVERDLDQLSLMPGPSALKAIEVTPDRGVFMKTPADFGDPEKAPFLFDRSLGER